MSLQGLDDPAVADAYQNALTEAGGWLLLRYASRDELTLLDRGAGGVPELRNAIDGYKETSPLYGFLQYRRRKVLISYMPPGLSRLVQARVTVQFQSILDKFSPHDSVFTLSQAPELTESALSSACLLHAASGSITSSSSSLRRRRLKEITEDAEESTANNNEAPGKFSNTRPPQRRTSQLSDVTVVPPDTSQKAPHAPGDDGTAPAVDAPSEAPADDDSSSISRVRSARPGSRGGPQEGPSQTSYESRKSSQSARPSFHDLGYTSRHQKVKLGPRPAVDNNGRPRTSGTLSRPDQRPVASLPAGVRSSPLRKPAPDGPRPRSQGSAVASVPTRNFPPVPPLFVPPPSIPISRPPTSPGAKSVGAISTMTSGGSSQEKERLMKALQLRKKQMEKRSEEKRNRKAAEEKLSPILDVTENKENVGRSHQPLQEGYDDRISAKSEKGKGPLSERQPSAVPEPIHSSTQANLACSDLSKPDSAVDMTISDSDCDRSSNTSPPSTAATPSSDHKAPSATSQVPPAAETGPDPVHEGSGVSGENEMRDGRSSTTVDAPPENKSQATPETKDLVPEQTATPPTPDLEKEEVPAETPPSIPLTSSTPSTTTPTSGVKPSQVVVTGVPEPQHDMSTSETSNAVEEGAIEQKEKRKHHLEPIQVPTPDYSDDDNLSDDSFMAELQSATVEEAKPVSVGKTPLTHGYASNESDSKFPDAGKNSRAISNPVVGRQHNTPAMSVGRSVSSPYYSEFGGPSTPVVMAKKINVSSGISNRIKALEKFSGRDQPPNLNQTGAPSAASLETHRRLPSAASLGGGNVDSTSASGRTSRVSKDLSRVPSVQRSASQPGIQATRRASSVSVIARINRDSTGAPNDSAADMAEPSTLNLQSSQLTIEHETSEVPLEDTTTADSTTNNSEKRMSTSSGGSQRPSLAWMGRSDSWMSISSRPKGEAIPEPTSTSYMASSSDEKKESRTSRVLRRMSSMTSNSRKSIMGTKNSTVTEQLTPSETERKEQSNPNMTHGIPDAIDVGEVNIQFPDTLLWKRRLMRIDDQGYLILTPGNADATSRNMIKRYHLSEFTAPCVPDEDEQEMPNSILLDFLNGSTLQAACESRQGQESVLQALVDAHNAHNQ